MYINDLLEKKNNGRGIYSFILINIKGHNMFGFVQILIMKIPHEEKKMFPKHTNNTCMKLL